MFCLPSICTTLNAVCCACSTIQNIYSCMRCGFSSTRVRVQYFTMWVICAFVAWILRDHGEKALIRVGGMKECDGEQCTSTGIVLRITLAMTLLSAALCVLTLGVKSSRESRALIQNDFFFIKWLVLAGVIVGTLYMDNFSISKFGYVSAFCSSLFMLAGIILVLECAHGWNDSWVANMDAGNKLWGYAILASAFLLLSCSITVWGLLFHYFGGDGCTEANVFISLTVVFSVVLTFISVLAKVQNGALLPSAVMVAYASYLCASAVIDIPVDNNSTCVNRHSRVTGATKEGIYSAGVVFTIFTVGYATIRNASSGNSLTPVPVKDDIPTAPKTADVEMQAAAQPDEEERTEYNYAFFHLVYAVGAMYLGMVLVDWDFKLLESNGVTGQVSEWTGVWIKIGSQWATFAVYLWSLIAPLVCSDRDFN